MQVVRGELEERDQRGVGRDLLALLCTRAAEGWDLASNDFLCTTHNEV